MRYVRYTAAAVLGAVVGAVVAVNIAIFSGVERGYESTLSEVFAHNPVAGVLVVIALIGGPIAGMFVLWTSRRDTPSR